MARDTSTDLRNQVMYCVFVRQYSKEGTFRKVQEDLPRIRSLGTDIIWLMPIHPIGEVHRKGSLGSPYAIRDYRAVNPEYGTMEDFRELVDAIHALGMKCIIDVVYNHTSPDSVLAAEHPEWFYHRPNGSFGNRIGDWTDIIDLDYSRRELWEYQIETLQMWAGIVDGFRCDVAPLVPLEFWLTARQEVEKVHPGCLWLSESVEPSFTRENRRRGMTSLSDSEIYQAFDISYEYDIYGDWIRCLNGEIPLAEYLQKVDQQEYIYPDNYVKLRFLENHDRPRACSLLSDESVRRNWTAFLFFQKGMPLIYNGQEMENDRQPGLFDKDPVDWSTGKDISGLISRLAEIKRHPLMKDGAYAVRDGGNGIIVAEYVRRDIDKSDTSDGEAQKLIGLFSTGGRGGVVRVDAADGTYRNLLGGEVRVEQGQVSVDGRPVVFEVR